MTKKVHELFKDLKVFFHDLSPFYSRQTRQDVLADKWRILAQDKYRQIALILAVTFHLVVLLLAIVAPLIMFVDTPKIPEIYTVNLYNAPEAAPPSVKKTVTIVAPATKKAVAIRPAPKNAVSLFPIRQRLLKEKKDKEARQRQKELQFRQIEQVKLDLLREQAENEAKLAEDALAAAKQQVAERIADIYKAGNQQPAEEHNSGARAVTDNISRGSDEKHKLEALEIYRARLFKHISPHWQLPELQEWDESLRAVIIMQVKRDGVIINSYFEKRSENNRFNQYAQKAIDNAQPLPPFPIDFHEKVEEIAVTFSPGGLL